MRQRKQKRQKRKYHVHNNPFTDLLPGLMCFLILPFWMRLYVLDNSLSSYPWFSGSDTWGDIFLYGKMQLFLVICGFILVVLVDAFLIRGEKIEATKALWFLFGYELFAVLSTIVSSYRDIAVHGCLEQFETIFVLLGYGLCCFYGYYLAKTRKHVNILFAAAVIAAFFLSFIGLFQFFGIDLLQLDVMKQIYVPEALKEYRNLLSFNFAFEKWNRVYMTLYNPNYVGSYICLIFPLVVWFIFRSKKIGYKIFCMVTAAFLFICLLGSGSMAGQISLTVVMLLYGVVLIKNRMKTQKKWIWMFSAVVLVAGVVAGMVFYVGTEKKDESIESKNLLLSEIVLYEDEVFVNYNGYPLTIGYQMDGDRIVPLFRDENGDPPMCEYSVDGEYYVIIDERMKDVEIGIVMEGDTIKIGYANDDMQWIFCKNPGENFQYLTKYQKPDDMVVAKTFLPASMDKLLTYRGYIWSRSIPLLKKYLFMGSGPDTFAAVFPQNDYVARYRQKKGFFEEILTRPHSLYFQWALQTGVLSFFCIMVFIGLSQYKAFQLLEKPEEKHCNIPNEAVFIGVSAYLLAGTCNDSCICVAPMFWILLGILLGEAEVTKSNI